jgi:hypothetical protein
MYGSTSTNGRRAADQSERETLMNDPRTRKQEAQLRATETQLSAMLASVLPRVARSGELIFFNSEFAPPDVQSHSLPQESEELFDLAHASVSLREELGEPVQDSVGELYLSACREAANSSNADRRGPRQLATWLLAELGSRPRA